MDDEGADRSADDSDEVPTDESGTAQDPASDGADESPDPPTDASDDAGDAPGDADGSGGGANDADEPVESADDPAAEADERVSDGPYDADGDADGSDEDADDPDDPDFASQADLPPAGDPDADYGPDDDEEWEDPFPDVEMEAPEVELDDEADEAYPANPHTPEPDPSLDDDTIGGDVSDAQPTESDGGYADPTSTTTVEDDFADGPQSDQEMPLADHIEEMVRRLGVVIVVLAVVAAVVFPFAERIINFLWFSYLPGSLSQCPANPDISQGGAACARVYNPLALIFARLKMASLAGLVVSLPVFVYETYLFMRPGLYPTERRYYLASVPTSLILAAAGVAFAHLLVLPAIFTYFVFYSEDATVIAFGLTETFDLMVLMLGGFAIIFQIPLFVSLALMMGIVTRRWMATKRLYFWGAFAGLAFLFSPDPTGMAPIIVAATMIVLFEGTLLLAKWTGRK
jgi:sec-independent protein translocase protein TatC